MYHRLNRTLCGALETVHHVSCLRKFAPLAADVHADRAPTRELLNYQT